MELIREKEFVAAILDPENEIFVIYVTTFTNLSSNTHPSGQSQITSLKADKTPKAILSKYAGFADIFSPDLAAELLIYIKINNYAINFIDN